MDRLELVPEGVRGAGNIMDYSPDLRVDGDVSVSGCGLTQFSSEIFGFVLDYYLMSGDGLTVKLLAPRFVSLDTVSVPVTVNVTGTCTGVVCELVSVSDGTVLFTESGTVSSGRVLFNVPVPDDVERECCWRVRVNSSNGGVTRSMGVVFIDGLSELVLTGSDDVVQLDEGIFLFASLFDGDGGGVAGVPVYFYELYEIASINITGDKSIIQTDEVVDVSAKLKDEDGSLIEGETIYFYKQSPIVYENDGTDLSTLNIPSTASVTVEDEALKITTSTTGEETISYDYDLNNSDNFIFECEVAKLGTSQSVAMFVKNGTTATGCWFSYTDDTNMWNGGITGSTFSNVDTGTLAVGDKIKIKQENGVITLYHNNNQIYSKTVDLGTNYQIGHYTNKDRIQYIKNIKIYELSEE